MTRTMTILSTLPAVLLAQPPARPIQSPSTFSMTTAADGSKTIDIQNVSHHLSSTQIPGRPKDERLLLRTTTHSKQILGDKGMEGTVTLEAWRLGADVRQKPLYTVKATGTEGHIVDTSLYVISRGLEEMEWWSVYKLGTGERLFDTHVPLLNFSIGRVTVQTRYVGLEIPEDDTKDARLKQPNVIGVLTYASENRVLCERLLTCDDAKRARVLRSYSDTTRKLTFNERQSLILSFRENFPSPPNPIDLVMLVTADEIDSARSQLPAPFHIAPWKR